ncbi:S-layer homology domain-containing protein [Paenibacillus sp. NPDC057886]|uniref:S-layer homology domain-containing protein n=1 Tax=Paenibacillus sp. NPDC057886 TaxID=3346270 RepID=UPI0036CF2BEC
MNRFTVGKTGLVLALFAALLSGCVGNYSSAKVVFKNDKPSADEQLYIRYADGTVADVPNPEADTTVTVPLDISKLTVGGYIESNGIAWVPEYSYDTSNFSDIKLNIDAIANTKPSMSAHHVDFTEAPKMDASRPGYVSVTLSVYNGQDNLVDGQTEIFLKSDTSNLSFYNTNPRMNSGQMTANGGFSSYTTNGYITFLIQANSPQIDKKISVYSGSKLLTDNLFHVVTDIKLYSTNVANSIPTGQTLSLNAEVTPTNAINPTVTWSVTNETGTATIDSESGELTGGDQGTVLVYATATDGSGVVGSVRVTITPLPVLVNSITLTGNTSVQVGQSIPLTANVLPDDATNSSVIWTVQNGTGKATIDTNGTLTGTSAGTVLVQAKAIDGSEVLGNVEITVTPVMVQSITVSGSNSVQSGQSIPLTANVLPADATNRSIVWTVQNRTGKATIDTNGVLTGTSAGTVLVQAKAADLSGVSGTKTVEITAINNGGTGGNSGGGTGGSSGGGSSSTPTTTPTPAPTPVVKPEPTTEPTTTPTVVPGPKFNEQVVNLDNLMTSLNQKIKAAQSNPAVQLSDTSTHWAATTVNTFVKLGVVTGYSDGSFHPNASITRAEFATLIAKVFDLSSSQGSAMSDVSGHWAEASIRSLQGKGVLSGYPDGTFKPNQEIKRSEMIAIISRIMDLTNVITTEAPVFTDLEQTWNKEQLQQAAAAGIITGDGKGEFHPANSASRAEALTIVLRVLQSNPELGTLLDSIQ